MNRDQHWHDEVLADSALNHLSPERERRLQAHLLVCERCSRRYEEWRSLLGEGRMIPETSPELKRRVMRSVTPTAQKEKPVHRVKPTLSGLGIVAGVLFVLLLFNINPMTFPDPYTAVQEKAVEQATFVHDPRTKHYDVAPVVMQDVSGNVWVNDITKEMLIRVEGLVPIVHKDYQMWFFDNRGGYNDEVLELQSGKAVLYLQGNGVERIQHVRTSLEPKGGSAKPTTNDMFIDVDLRR